MKSEIDLLKDAVATLAGQAQTHRIVIGALLATHPDATFLVGRLGMAVEKAGADDMSEQPDAERLALQVEARNCEFDLISQLTIDAVIWARNQLPAGSPGDSSEAG